VNVLIFHGYLLRGTGSNIYNASLARALVDLGHEVHILCQDRAAADRDFVDAVGTWDAAGRLQVEQLHDPVRCTAYLPPIGRVLPVYVQDAYAGFDAKRFADLDQAELDAYLDANVAAVRDVTALAHPDLALANHLVMGPAIIARAIGGEVPYAVTVHGSALEYTVRPEKERFLPYAHEGVAAASAVLVGSRHTAESLFEVMGDPDLPARTRLGPPGVDVGTFRPLPAPEAAQQLRGLADRLEGAGETAWGGEPAAAETLRALDPQRDKIVSYVGKLIVSKGVDLLLAAWPLVVERVPDARLLVIGFGTYRDTLERMRAALGQRDLDTIYDIAARGRELEGGEASRLSYLLSFLDSLDGAERERYLEAAAEAARRVSFTGRLEHDDLPAVLPASAAQVVPSTFPEAFGMVAAEAAACGALPLSAAHSGLAEVTTTLVRGVPEGVARLMSFELGPGAVREIADKLCAWLELDESERARATATLAETARERYGWHAVARGVIAAAQGRLDALPEVPSG
jgi:glycosyltransferase involved in cell wall biosynthesis